jgi:hypothetical protein
VIRCWVALTRQSFSPALRIVVGLVPEVELLVLGGALGIA